MNLIKIFSLLLEAVTAVLGLRIALGKDRPYGWLIALTFTIYVIYDYCRFINYPLPAQSLLFLIASLAIFWAVWIIAD